MLSLKRKTNFILAGVKVCCAKALKSRSGHSSLLLRFTTYPYVFNAGVTYSNDGV